MDTFKIEDGILHLQEKDDTIKHINTNTIKHINTVDINGFTTFYENAEFKKGVIFDGPIVINNCERIEKLEDEITRLYTLLFGLFILYLLRLVL